MKIDNKVKMLLALAVFVASSCGTDDDEDYTPKQEETTSNLSEPTFAKNLTTTTQSEVSFRSRFDNGGDTYDNMSCVVHYATYSSKQSKTPKTSALSKRESMRVYSSTKHSTTFDKTHTGYSGGTYVYYYFECSNSKYTTKTDVTFCVVKR